MKQYAYFLLFIIALGWISSAFAAPLVSFSSDGDRETIRLSVPDADPHEVFTLDRPDRLVVDVPAIPGRNALSLPSSYDGTLVKGMRFAQFDPKTSRFVFDLSERVRIVHVQVEDKKLAVEIVPVKKKAQAVPVKETQKEEKKEKPKKQAELPLIVIDPGHGGVDPGTVGEDGAQEKHVVLDYAKALQARLAKSGRYRVLLTRGDDRFIILRRRFDIARKARGDLFISLHADSAPDDVRGLSVYTLSEKASDEETEALAARENKADVLAGVNLTNEREDVAGILISLAQRETSNRSALLADLLVVSLQEKIRLLPNTHRFAGFAVLKAPDIPSVLIEIGFLSHPGEEKLLKSRAYRDKVVGGIFTGIDAYFRKKKAGDE